MASGGPGRGAPSPAGDHVNIAIVGGGAAGCVVARRLAETLGGSVLLLEAGPDLRRGTPPGLRDGWRLPTPPDWGFQSEPDQTGSTSKLRRGRLLGGSSWLTRFAVRGAAADFDAWAAGGNPGWTFADVLPSFRRIESDMEFGAAPWHATDGPIPITRYPDQVRSEIHEAALEAFAATGFPSVADHNAPGAVGVGPMPMSSRSGAGSPRSMPTCPLTASCRDSRSGPIPKSRRWSSVAVARPVCASSTGRRSAPSSSSSRRGPTAVRRS